MKPIYILVIIAFSSCIGDKKKPESFQGDNGITKESQRESLYLKTTVRLNSIEDTNSVTFDAFGQRFEVSYYHNRPQFVNITNPYRVNRAQIGDFAESNKGVYLEFMPDTTALAAIGLRYFDGHSGIDVALKPMTTEVELFKVWSQYKNDGRKYDVSRVEDGKIVVYTYKEGDLVDSSIYYKR